MFCWKTFGPSVYVDVTLTHSTNLNIGVGQVHPIATVSPDGNDLFQQDNAPCCIAKIVREWVEEHDEEFKVLPWLLNSPHLN